MLLKPTWCLGWLVGWRVGRCNVQLVFFQHKNAVYFSCFGWCCVVGVNVVAVGVVAVVQGLLCCCLLPSFTFSGT